MSRNLKYQRGDVYLVEEHQVRLLRFEGALSDYEMELINDGLREVLALNV